MPGKQKIAAPIDRPLSRAYLRQFIGMSTAYPPGQSEPNSLRVMENMLVDRNRALAIRPGLKFLSYSVPPDIDEVDADVPGTAYSLPPVGAQEPFYVLNGEKALLFAVREVDDSVGFRALLFSDNAYAVYGLTDAKIGFSIPQGEAALRFSSATKHVQYLQIDNRIIAMSDAGEPIRIFYVGAQKVAKRLNSISVPEWDDTHKLSARHPDAAWIGQQTYTIRQNIIPNPSFEIGSAFWSVGAGGQINGYASGLTSFGSHLLQVVSVPSRTNMCNSPLHDVAGVGIGSWYSSETYGEPRLLADSTWLKIIKQNGVGKFLAQSSKMLTGVKAGERYRVAFDYELGAHVEPAARVQFYATSGALLGNGTWLEPPDPVSSTGRYVSGSLIAPTGAVAMKVWIGGDNLTPSSTFIRVKNVVVCQADESTDAFHGDSGTNYYWVGTANRTASVYHPPVDVKVSSGRGPVRGGSAATASIYARCSADRLCTVALTSFDRNSAQVDTNTGWLNTGVDTWVRPSAVDTVIDASAITAQMDVTFTGLARGDVALLDAALVEPGVSFAGVYFDGSTAHTTTTANAWEGGPHTSLSVQEVRGAAFSIPAAETPTANTLVASGGAASNPYKIGLFYTFSNEVGESAPSKVTEIRTSRPWSNWRWETANASGEPSGTGTDNESLCADQLVVVIPQAVYDRALAEGATQWNLYAFSWSDQEPVPVEASRVAEQRLYTDISALSSLALPYAEGGWLAVTPSRRLSLYSSPLPSVTTRVNYSRPPKSRQGLVAGDRLILVGDPEGLATIKWSSNQFGEYTNFTANIGGGEKTLTTGNLNIPALVALWQNPQSVDTITILCMGGDGMSNSYYMTPASVSGGSGIVTVMGFEETTSTPGTLSPYAAEVINNALYRPTNQALLKSTAQNYNINHKSLTDKIENMWKLLRTKHLMMTAQLDNRLYLLVHNPEGALLEATCKGNEIWVYDIGSEEGIWSRFLVQGSALRPFDVGSSTYMGVVKSDGLYYFDPEARLDDYVAEDGSVLQRPIPWAFETNTQGANRAHDAWAHLQQVAITLGNFKGSLDYGIRGLDVNGRLVDVSKRFQDARAVDDSLLRWDVEDPLLVRRDLKEWTLYGRSVDGEESSGHIALAQYRYTPVSVNVGYEFGSIETFEYAGNAASGPNSYTENGVPLPYQDYRRV